MPIIESRIYKKATLLSLQTGFQCGRHAQFPHRPYSSQSHTNVPFTKTCAAFCERLANCWGGVTY